MKLFNWRMMRGIQKIYGSNRCLLLEPYASSFQVTSNYASSVKAEPYPKLLTLPVPKLQDTMQKYLTSVKPLLTEEEYDVTSSLIKDFLAEGGVGQKLQKLLQKRATEHKNWLEEWWLKTAYLGYRDPVTVYSSPGLVFPFRQFESQTDQLRYAAKTLLAALEYKGLIDNDKIKTEMMGKFPLDMGQYKKIFGTCRIPGLEIDSLSYNSSTKHVTVIHNNSFFHVDVYGADGVQLNEDQLVEQLQKIVYMSPCPANWAVGILTSDNRDNWAKAYQELIKDPVNKKSLKDIEKSIVVMCLDKPVGLWAQPDKSGCQTLAAAQCIHGQGTLSNGGNRWFDKTVQFIVGADGLTGLTYEHSPAEGQPIAVMTDFIMNYLDKRDEKANPASKCPTAPEKLEFVINEEVECMILTASSNLDRLVNDLELNCFTFENYGKNFIKSQKMSPDSYIQMAMQYTFYRMYGVPAAHYESAATRMFHGGRTETIRSCSCESVEFAQLMLDPYAGPHQKVAALRRAVDGHKNYTVNALQGLGVDRHLLGLKLTALENGIELPALFKDASFIKSTSFRLSTSQVACKCDGFMAYGPLVPNGYGSCYNPRDENMNFGTSCFVSNPETSCVTYRCALEQSLIDMQDALMKVTPSKL